MILITHHKTDMPITWFSTERRVCTLFVVITAPATQADFLNGILAYFLFLRRSNHTICRGETLRPISLSLRAGEGKGEAEPEKGIKEGEYTHVFYHLSNPNTKAKHREYFHPLPEPPSSYAPSGERGAFSNVRHIPP